MLVTGGASSGKSAYAEALASALGTPRYYLAAMRPYGEEGARRVHRHRAQRAGRGFTTVECFDGLDVTVLKGGVALVECLGNVVANALFAPDGEQRSADEAHALTVNMFAEVGERCEHMVIVGNEVGCDGVDYDESTHAYIELLGRIACEYAAASDAVVEVSAGIPCVAKGTNALAGVALQKGGFS